MIMPVLLFILMGVIDLGSALVMNKKLVSSGQIAADLLARQEIVDDNELEEAIVAAELAMLPYGTQSFGIDIASIRFTGSSATPNVQWRETRNMSANNDVLTGAAGLGRENEGVVAVTVRYTFNPRFAKVITGTMDMSEVAYVRGRKTSFVGRD